jgi:hypothetical protein
MVGKGRISLCAIPDHQQSLQYHWTGKDFYRCQGAVDGKHNSGWPLRNRALVVGEHKTAAT